MYMADEVLGYKMADGMSAAIKSFQLRGSSGDAMVIRIVHSSDELQIEESCKGLSSIEDLAEKIEDAIEPRYLLFIHKQSHTDGRVSYPIAFIVFMPPNVPASLKMMYTRLVPALVEKFRVAKQFSLSDPEDLTTEWLEEKLAGR